MDFSLIETLRWEPEEGFLRLDQHMRRLSRSADALGFRQPQGALDALKQAAAGDAALRVRLTMNFRGRVEVTVSPFEQVAKDAVWRVQVAQKTRLKSEDTLYRHKTSRREPYEAARAEFSPKDVDEVLLLNERGELCEGTFTNIFIQQPDGAFLTPPLSSGLLPGILRADLIREKRARSEVLKPKDLAGRALFVGNSLRGLIRAELVPEYA